MPNKGFAVLLVAFLPAISQGARCPDGYSNYFGDKCYQVNQDTMSWSAARSFCQLNDPSADLASIHSKAENDAIKAAVSPATRYWIGLKCINSTFVWSDGSRVSYTNDAECDEGLAYYFNTGAWESIIATENHQQVICESAPPVVTTTAAPPPPPPPAADSDCGLGYFLIGDDVGTCVRISSNVSTWDDAEAECQQDGGHLASIHSKQSNEVVRQLALASRQMDAIFIGFRLANSSSSWVDGSDFDYSNFDPGMPNALFGDCGAMQTGALRGEWTSIFCDASNRLPFACAKPAPCPAMNTFAVAGNITSPEYPSSRSSGLSCEYFVAASPGSLVLLRFDEFQLVDGDQVILYEGEGRGDPLAIITSATPADRYLTRTLSVMRIVHQTGVGSGIRKWHATFASI